MPYTFTTSGSTGVPKSFTVSDDFMEARGAARAGAKGPALAGMRSIFCDVPLSSIAGKSYEVWARQNDAKFFSQIDGGGSIERALKLFVDEDIDVIISTPSGFVNYAEAAGGHRFRTALATGAPLNRYQIGLIRNKLSSILYSTYGASEVGSIAQATADMVLETPGCVGVLAPGVQIRFDGAGLLQVRTETMISGYTDPALTARYFTLDGWFVPGDLGHLKDDLLVLTGRARNGL